MVDVHPASSTGGVVTPTRATTRRLAARSEAERRARVRWWVLTPAVFALAWGGNHFTPLLHLYKTAGSYSAWETNLLLGMYVFGLGPGLLVASALSDKSGRKPVLLSGVALSLVGSAILAMSLEHFALLCAGRVLVGIGVGVAMSVGTTWMTELSRPPFDRHATAAAGARRPALTLTLGFGIGAGVSGCLAQWAPYPTVLPFAVHGLLALVGIVLAALVPETRGPEQRVKGSWMRDVRIPRGSGSRFASVILPAAPWVFAAAGVAYAIIPSSMESVMGDATTLYATVLAVLTLGVGALAQGLVPPLNRITRGRALSIGLAVMVMGILLAAVVTALGDPLLSLVAAAVLGGAYGICVLSGLIIIQTIAGPNELAGSTGIYYALTYSGFLLPTLLAWAVPLLSYTESLLIVAGVCVACWAVVTMALIRKP